MQLQSSAAQGSKRADAFKDQRRLLRWVYVGYTLVIRWLYAGHEVVNVFSGCCNDFVMWDLFKCCHQVEQRLPVMLGLESSCFCLEGNLPCSALSPHACTSEYTRSVSGGLERFGQVRAGAHPNPNDGWEQTDGSSAPVGLGKQNNQDQLDDCTSLANNFACHQQSAKCI